MFCIYEVGEDWVAELIDRGKLKLTARAKTPVLAIEALYAMIGEDNDESGSSAVEDGAVAIAEGSRSLPPNCT